MVLSKQMVIAQLELAQLIDKNIWLCYSSFLVFSSPLCLGLMAAHVSLCTIIVAEFHALSRKHVGDDVCSSLSSLWSTNNTQFYRQYPVSRGGNFVRGILPPEPS